MTEKTACLSNNTPKSSKRKGTAIYTTHTAEKQLFHKALVNGKLCAAYIKDGNLVAYASWEEVNREMYTGPYLEFTTTQ